MNKYLHTTAALDRLKREYLQYGKLVVAYDFDDTVCTYTQGNPEPTAERPANEEICELIRQLAPYASLVVWTCRSLEQKNNNEEHSALEEALKWLEAHNVPYDYVNEDAKVSFGGRKIYTNILLDDRAGLISAYETLIWFLQWVKEQPKQEEVIANV